MKPYVHVDKSFISRLKPHPNFCDPLAVSAMTEGTGTSQNGFVVSVVRNQENVTVSSEDTNVLGISYITAIMADS